MSRGLVSGIVSGGQTGVDRAALDAAIASGVPCSGWCPAGRAAEDGPLAADYPLREAFSSDPAVRTAWNVFDTDATLVLSPEPLSGGTRSAVEVARRFERPVLVLDPSVAAPETIEAWLRGLPAAPLLNVAGPRESESPGIHARARDLLAAVLARSGPAEEAPRRVLVTGGGGYLGSHLVRCAPPGREVHSTVRSSLARDGSTHRVELSEAEAVRDLLEELRPELVIHAAYGTAEGQRDIVRATRAVARGSARIGARLIHLSSDMVLDGESAPFDESAEPAPVHQYGRWKAEAEEIVRREHPGAALIRASLMTAFDPPDPRTEWVLSGLRGECRVALFVDEIRTPILVEDLGRQIWEIARLEENRGAGVWNLAAPEAFSRYALGALIAAAYGSSPAPLAAATSAGFDEPRPRDLRLLVGRASRELWTRARPLSEAAAECRSDRMERFEKVDR